jgi:hypothetical protein
MEEGDAFMLIIVLFVYIVPIGTVLIGGLSRNNKYAIIAVPSLFTLMILSLMASDGYDYWSTRIMYPEMFELKCKNSTNSVKDSIIELQLLMAKLPRRLDDNSVEYSIDRHKDRYNQFRFNWRLIGDYQNLANANALRSVSIPSKVLTEGESHDNIPFDTLSNEEVNRFLELIKFLDANKLTGAKLDDAGSISIFYNDSLSFSEQTQLRRVVLDTSGFYSSESFRFLDSRDGMHLIVSRR